MLRWCCDVMQILVATLRGAVHQHQRAAAYAGLLPSLVQSIIARSDRDKSIMWKIRNTEYIVQSIIAWSD